MIMIMTMNMQKVKTECQRRFVLYISSEKKCWAAHFMKKGTKSIFFIFFSNEIIFQFLSPSSLQNKNKMKDILSSPLSLVFPFCLTSPEFLHFYVSFHSFLFAFILHFLLSFLFSSFHFFLFSFLAKWNSVDYPLLIDFFY